MSLKERWKAPTPIFYKQLIKICLTLAACAVALLTADTVGKAIMPDFSYKLLPLTKLIAKNVFVLGLVIAAGAKFAKQSDDSPDKKE